MKRSSIAWQALIFSSDVREKQKFDQLKIKTFQLNRCALDRFIFVVCRFILPNSISVSCLIISLQIEMCAIIHNVCSWRRSVECVNRHAVLLILLVLTSLLTYLLRLLPCKLIKLHMLCTVWNFRLFVSQHLDLSLIYIR